MVHWRAQEEVGTLRQTLQTRCISEHRNRFGPTQDRRGALVSTKQTGILGQTHRRGALASTETDLDPPGDTTDVVHWQSQSEVGTLQADTTDEVN